MSRYVNKYKWIILSAIIFFGIIVRFYGINLPLLDSHQVRQTQTAMMARNLYEDNMNLFLTRLDVFGNNPGHIILEFPLMHSITASLYYLFGMHDVIGRLVSIAFSIGAMFLMYGLARYFLSHIGALAALALYAFSPMNIYFSRAFMPESSMMFFMVGSMYFILKWLDKQIFLWYLTAIIFAALAYLTKPTAILILTPILIAWLLKYSWRVFKRLDFWLYMFLTVTPFILWGAYANYFNSSISYCTFGYADSWLEIIRIRGTIKHWLGPHFYSFIGGSVIFLLLTPLGFVGAVRGALYAKKNNKRMILYSWLGAILIYFYGLAEPNSTHVYYHLHLLPLAAIFFGFAIEWLSSKRELLKEIFKKKVAIWIGTVLIALTLMCYGIGYFKYFNYMYSNRMPYVLEVSEIIKKHAPKNRFIIDNQNGLLVAVLSYYSNSKAQFFTISEKSIQELETLRAQGATTFVTMESDYGSSVQATEDHKDFWQYLNKNYKPLAITKHYHIFDLRIPLTKGNE